MLKRYEGGEPRGAHALFCLYSMEDSPVTDPSKAFHWATVDFEREASGFYMSHLAEAHRFGQGTERDLVQAAKYWYLNACQETPDTPLSEYYQIRLGECSVEELNRGRVLAREWIQENGAKYSEFQGEKHDPFERYLRARQA